MGEVLDVAEAHRIYLTEEWIHLSFGLIYKAFDFAFVPTSNRWLHVRIQAEQITRVIFILDFHQAAIVPEVVHVHHTL